MSFLTGRELNISLAFVRQSYFVVPRDIRLNSTHCFIRKTPNKRNIQQIGFNDLSDIDFKDYKSL